MEITYRNDESKEKRPVYTIGVSSEKFYYNVHYYIETEQIKFSKRENCGDWWDIKPTPEEMKILKKILVEDTKGRVDLRTGILFAAEIAE
jgi:hypothetical protein